ncbi:MAG: hypothetical protein KKB31_00365 [Nanoarchaeota archaeon]|nr:hypothetical protein [Nanoarchaeota archaeon]
MVERIRVVYDMPEGVAHVGFSEGVNPVLVILEVVGGLERVGRDVRGASFFGGRYQIYFRGTMEEPEDLVA